MGDAGVFNVDRALTRTTGAMTKLIFCVGLLLAASARAAPDCNTYSDCTSCAGASEWFPGATCRWCPKEGMCHAEGSAYNTCSSSESVYKPGDCSAAPPPAPPPPPPSATDFALKSITALFQHFNISIDPATCVSDVGRADIQFKEFAQDAEGKNYSLALTSLSRGLYAISTASSSSSKPSPLMLHPARRH